MTSAFEETLKFGGGGAASGRTKWNGNESRVPHFPSRTSSTEIRRGSVTMVSPAIRMHAHTNTFILPPPPYPAPIDRTREPGEMSLLSCLVYSSVPLARLKAMMAITRSFGTPSLLVSMPQWQKAYGRAGGSNGVGIPLCRLLQY